jgi:hypothetical protein
MTAFAVDDVHAEFNRLHHRGAGRHLRQPSYLWCWRRTISVIQLGANGDVQFGGVG